MDFGQDSSYDHPRPRMHTRGRGSPSSQVGDLRFLLRRAQRSVTLWRLCGINLTPRHRALAFACLYRRLRASCSVTAVSASARVNRNGSGRFVHWLPCSNELSKSEEL
ncbi:Hypothetical protein NTJ_05531 [Nesidiocoris tenuis]|uniref:Uncharacterized protein n=1 Tax=Nesidiocoris tenuis TaxID=355587 RepID=A0ABN7AQQ1_9HEMI|nr:Hypothetical protein NTJ_05531 [Nesidiocoris tenuis]